MKLYVEVEKPVKDIQEIQRKLKGNQRDFVFSKKEKLEKYGTTTGLLLFKPD